VSLCQNVLVRRQFSTGAEVGYLLVLGTYIVASEAIYKWAGAFLAQKKFGLCPLLFTMGPPISFCSVISLCVYCYVKGGSFLILTLSIPVLLVDKCTFHNNNQILMLSFQNTMT